MLYLVMTEDETFGVSCAHRWQAELASVWIGFKTYLKLRPQRVHLLTIGNFGSEELQKWADEYKAWSPKGYVRRSDGKTVSGDVQR